MCRETRQNHPVTYLAQFGVSSKQVLRDVVDFWKSGPGRPRTGRGGHILTGPVYVQDAEPGDMLEIQIMDLQTRVPYGINNAGPTGGVLGSGYAGAVGPYYSGTLGDNYPGRLSIVPPVIPPFGPVGNRNLIWTGKARGRDVAFFSDEITVPLGPFMGIMAVAPSPTVGEPGVTVPDVQSSTPPGIYGGNMDVKDLTIGSTLYLPVFHPGALFYTGDPHSAQGDGEVSGTAIEHSLTGIFRFIVHKKTAIKGPRAEDANYYIMMGIDLDLDRAMRLAVQEVVNFLISEKGLAARLRLLAREHRRRLPRRRGGRSDTDRDRQDPEVDLQEDQGQVVGETFVSSADVQIQKLFESPRACR